jgi:iron complex outermembrane receptor protein
LFAEDTLAVWDPLKLVAGFRFEHIEMNSRNLIEGTSFEREFNPVTWRVGFVYEPVAGLSLYGQRSTGVDSVESIITLEESERDFDLSSGRQYELGLKHSFWQDRVEWTFAYFDIVKEDLLTRDPRDPARTLQIGEQSSDGIELTAAIHPLSNLTLSGNFSRLNAQFDEFNEDIGGVAVSRAGNLPPKVPETLGNLWLYYSPASYIDLGVGARYVGKRVADNANTIELDAYTTVDIFATWKYKWGALTVRGRNLSDEQYAIAPYNNGTQVILADPRAYEVVLQVNL